MGFPSFVGPQEWSCPRRLCFSHWSTRKLGVTVLKNSSLVLYVFLAFGGENPRKKWLVVFGSWENLGSDLSKLIANSHWICQRSEDPKCFWLTNFLETLLVQVPSRRRWFTPPGGKGLWPVGFSMTTAMTGVVPHDRGHPKSISEVPCLKLKFIHEIFKHEYLGTTPPTAVPVTFFQDYSIF